MVRESGMDMYTLPYLKWITHKDYCIAHGTLLKIMLQSNQEGNLGEKKGHMDTYD